MKARLIKHYFDDEPNWEIVRKEIPIGQIYEVIGETVPMTIINNAVGKTRKVICYLVTKEGDRGAGYLPSEVLEIIYDS